VRQQTYKDKLTNTIIQNIQNNNDTINNTIDNLLIQLKDPYSVHLTGDSNRIFQQILDGEINGIGSALTKSTQPYLTITKIIDKSPAMKANLMIGDRITRIDDYSITT
jgi:carboxyl-terminal processing protease